MKKILGIELGSTRIKAVLIDENAALLAQGSFEWENTLVEFGGEYRRGAAAGHLLGHRGEEAPPQSGKEVRQHGCGFCTVR